MAGVKLYLATSDIWSHYFKNADRLQTQEDCVAESSENGMALYITGESIFPQLMLYVRDKLLIQRSVSTKEECSKWAVYLIMKYVAGVPADEDIEEEDEKPKIIEMPSRKYDEPVDEDTEDECDSDDKEQKIMDVIYEREDELSQAMADFLAVVLCEYDCAAVKEEYGDAFIDGIVDDFLQYLADNHCLSVYRPVLEEDPETGEEILKEFPYGWDTEYGDIN